MPDLLQLSTVASLLPGCSTDPFVNLRLLIFSSVRVNLKRPIIIKEIKLQFKGRAVYLGNLKHSSKKFIIPSENEKVTFKNLIYITYKSTKKYIILDLFW